MCYDRQEIEREKLREIKRGEKVECNVIDLAEGGVIPGDDDEEYNRSEILKKGQVF